MPKPSSRILVINDEHLVLREFVKGLPLFGGGFEIETELTIKAVERGYRVCHPLVIDAHRANRDAGVRHIQSFKDIVPHRVAGLGAATDHADRDRGGRWRHRAPG